VNVPWPEYLPAVGGREEGVGEGEEGAGVGEERVGGGEEGVGEGVDVLEGPTRVLALSHAVGSEVRAREKRTMRADLEPMLLIGPPVRTA
jgi:hypothetical protein